MYCSGDVIQDLQAWWFKMRCSLGKMRVVATQWGEVVTDPRYKVRPQEGAGNTIFMILLFQDTVGL